MFHCICKAPRYQHKFRPKVQFSKLFEINFLLFLNLELKGVFVILKTKFYKKKNIFDTFAVILSQFFLACLEHKVVMFQNPILFCAYLGPFNRTKMVLYSKCTYGSQFSGEKDHRKIRCLVAEIKKKPSLILFGTTCRYFEGVLRSAESTTPKSDLFLQTRRDPFA